MLGSGFQFVLSPFLLGHRLLQSNHVPYPPSPSSCIVSQHLMSRTIGKTPFKWEKGVGIRVVLDLRAACHVQGQYLGLVSVSGI